MSVVNDWQIVYTKPNCFIVNDDQTWFVLCWWSLCLLRFCFIDTFLIYGLDKMSNIWENVDHFKPEKRVRQDYATIWGGACSIIGKYIRLETEQSDWLIIVFRTSELTLYKLALTFFNMFMCQDASENNQKYSSVKINSLSVLRKNFGKQQTD